MNRETKRALQRQGAINADGQPVRATSSATGPKGPRVGPMEFIRQVQSELHKVEWPTRQEVRKYTIVVAVAIIIFASITFGLDTLFAKAVFWLYLN